MHTQLQLPINIILVLLFCSFIDSQVVFNSSALKKTKYSKIFNIESIESEISSANSTDTIKIFNKVYEDSPNEENTCIFESNTSEISKTEIDTDFEKIVPRNLNEALLEYSALFDTNLQEMCESTIYDNVTCGNDQPISSNYIPEEIKNKPKKNIKCEVRYNSSPNIKKRCEKWLSDTSNNSYPKLCNKLSKNYKQFEDNQEQQNIKCNGWSSTSGKSNKVKESGDVKNLINFFESMNFGYQNSLKITKLQPPVDIKNSTVQHFHDKNALNDEIKPNQDFENVNPNMNNCNIQLKTSKLNDSTIPCDKETQKFNFSESDHEFFSTPDYESSFKSSVFESCHEISSFDNYLDCDYQSSSIEKIKI